MTQLFDVDELSVFLAKKLDVDEDSLKDALTEYKPKAKKPKDDKKPSKEAPKKAKEEVKEAPKKTPKGTKKSEEVKPKKTDEKAKASKKKPQAEESGDESHTCEYTPKTGAKQGTPCGHSATLEIGGMWYCGTQDDEGNYTGHAKSGAAAAAKAAPKTLVDKKTQSDNKSKALMKKVVPKETTINFINIGDKWVEPKTRLLVTKDKNEAYGVLDKDNKKILPMTEAATRYAEANGIKIRPASGAAKSEKTTAASKGKEKSEAKDKGSKTPAPAKKKIPVPDDSDVEEKVKEALDDVEPVESSSDTEEKKPSKDEEEEEEVEPGEASDIEIPEDEEEAKGSDDEKPKEEEEEEEEEVADEDPDEEDAGEEEGTVESD